METPFMNKIDSTKHRNATGKTYFLIYECVSLRILWRDYCPHKNRKGHCFLSGWLAVAPRIGQALQPVFLFFFSVFLGYSTTRQNIFKCIWFCSCTRLPLLVETASHIPFIISTALCFSDYLRLRKKKCRLHNCNRATALGLNFALVTPLGKAKLGCGTVALNCYNILKCTCRECKI